MMRGKGCGCGWGHIDGDGFGDSDGCEGGGYGDGNGLEFGNGRGSGGSPDRHGFGHTDAYITGEENPHCTRTVMYDMRFFICQQVMVGL